jgi:hypothetical protein
MLVGLLFGLLLCSIAFVGFLIIIVAGYVVYKNSPKDGISPHRVPTARRAEVERLASEGKRCGLCKYYQKGRYNAFGGRINGSWQCFHEEIALGRDEWNDTGRTPDGRFRKAVTRDSLPCWEYQR